MIIKHSEVMEILLWNIWLYHILIEWINEQGVVGSWSA